MGEKCNLINLDAVLKLLYDARDNNSVLSYDDIIECIKGMPVVSINSELIEYLKKQCRELKELQILFPEYGQVV